METLSDLLDATLTAISLSFIFFLGAFMRVAVADGATSRLPIQRRSLTISTRPTVTNPPLR